MGLITMIYTFKSENGWYCVSTLAAVFCWYHIYIWNDILLKFVPRNFDDKTALAQVMSLCKIGNKANAQTNDDTV